MIGEREEEEDVVVMEVSSQYYDECVACICALYTE